MFAEELPAASAEEIALRLSRRPGFFWLDGECADHGDGRWSFLGCEPIAERRACLGDAQPLSVLPEADPADADEPAVDCPGAPLPKEVPRWVGYLAYDAHLSGRPQRLRRDPTQPVAWFARYAALLARSQHGRWFVVGDGPDEARRLRACLESAPRAVSARLGPLEVSSVEHHRAALRKAFEHIAAGDIYQVNLARCFTAALSGDPLSLWLSLRRQGAVPLGCYLDDGHAQGGRAILSRSMERFLRFEPESRQLCSRPIKGTLARQGRDRQEARALRADPKERAEHAMIVDLMRNDLGRVAEIGSVCVPEVMVVERYAGLCHLVSTVRCRVRKGVGLREIVEATFPAGSVTGAPKHSATRIIEALEPSPRDAYTGALGFVDRAGGLSLSVAIRSAVAEGGRVRYWAGGGIVEASQVEREVAETELKARVFLQAAAEHVAVSASSRAPSKPPAGRLRSA